ncbi:MAG: hypothetical protein KAQ75_08000, partial [Bacteroidales bacterium]|nr:hypothetical protein [Bacteroidales bacterium]
PDNVTLESAGGASGYAEDLHPEIHTHKAKSGSVGTEKINIKVPLTGFLFNSITSDQQVCMNDSSLIVGTEPRGGNGTFTFQWQDSPDGSVWSDISGATERDYQTPALSDTTYFQRIVTSGSIVDEGNEVEIIVHDYVVDNTIFGDDLITCIGNEADTITGTEVILGGDNISYQYIWESSTDQNAWNTISLLNDTVCLPGIVTDTTFIRRRVISGGCKDTAWLSNPIIGLPQILNNDLSPDQEICYGQIPDEIIGVEPSGGNGVYDPLYWEEKTESSSWSIVTDSTRYNFAPAELFETTYYRRIVESDDCFDVSDSIKINVLLPIDNDSINETELLIYTCYNIPPQLINGSTPTGGGGVGTYTYKWQESVDGLSWTDIASTDVEDYQAGALIVKTYFRRLVSSGLDGCCTSASDSIIIDIYPLPEATIADLIDTTCSGDEIILDFTITNGQIPYTLTYNDGETPSVINNIITTDTIHKVNPSTILESEEFNYTIDSVVDYNGCIATEITGLTKITVYGKPTADAGIDDEVCQLSYVLSATTSFDNTNGIWTQIPNDGSTDFDDNTLKNTGLEVTLAGLYSYIWEETNWQCEESDTVEITMYKNLYNIDIIRPFDKGDIDTILRFVEEVNFKGNYYNPDTFKTVIEKNWEVFNGDPGITISPSDTAKNVTFGLLNDAGNEYIEIQWHVDKGVCLDTTIIRRI